MKSHIFCVLFFAGWGMLSTIACRQTPGTAVTVPFILDHNRMLVQAEFQRPDGTWRPVRLWVDSGNPDLFISAELARDLGIHLAAAGGGTVAPPAGLRIGAKELNIRGVQTVVLAEPRWLFSAAHNDANLPATVLQRYMVIFDYPRRSLTLADPGSLKPRGRRSSASINPKTGIVQIDAEIDGDRFSFALDNGASFSFASGEVLEKLLLRHPGWPRMKGTAGCANMWGWWPPREQTLPVLRVPLLLWGGISLSGVGIVGVDKMSPDGPSMGAWYSRKTVRPVDGFLGPNAFKGFRVEIDYAAGAVYFEKDKTPEPPDLDLVGLAVRLEADGRFRVIGVVEKNGKPVLTGVQPGDILLQVDNLAASGATMGTVIDAFRGRPGDQRSLLLERDNRRFRVTALVKHLL